MYLSEVPIPEQTVAPAAAALSTEDAKKHLELSGSAHDTFVADLVEAARLQFEHDTGWCLITRTMQVKLPYLMEFQFSTRPVGAITSITYFDGANSSQTLSTDVYQLDTPRNQLRLAYQQVWPTTADRWDAVTVTYTAGTHAGESTVEQVAKQAMLLLVGRDFYDREDMAHTIQQRYDALVSRYIRSSYP